MSPDFSSLSPSAPGTFPQPAGLVQLTVDRRVADQSGHGSERRQFGSSHSQLSAEAKELAEAIDRYKLQHRRRYITYEEILSVIRQIGYRRQG